MDETPDPTQDENDGPRRIESLADWQSLVGETRADWQSRVDWPLRTERLTIRPARAEDAEAVWSYRRRPEVHRWLTTAPATADDFRVHFADPGRLSRTLVIERPLVIEEQVDHRTGGAPELIGDLMLAPGDLWAQTEVAAEARDVQAELGWCLRPESSGHGFAEEAVRALIDVCFDRLGMHRVVANCFAANEASIRLMRRLGMREELHGRADSLHRDLGWSDSLGCALLAQEWRELSAGGRSAGTR